MYLHKFASQPLKYKDFTLQLGECNNIYSHIDLAW